MVFAVSHLPMSPPPVTGPVPHVREMNEIKDLYVAQAEHAAKRARDELTAYSSMMVDERRRFVDPATVTHATAQYEAQLSHQQLQHSSELQTLRKQVDEARMETAVTVDQLRQNHEAVTQLAIASHRDSMAKAQAEHEDNLQHALARQHEGHSMAIVDLSEKHRLALASIERHWMEKVEQLHSEHAALLNQIQASNDMRLKQLEGDHSLDMQFLQEKEIRDRAGQVSMVNEKLRAAEAATLHLQVQIADLTAKLEGTAAQLRATELQALQAKEGMESNLRGLMVAIDDERAGRQAAEARLQTALGDSQRRMAELTDAHRLEMQQTHDANARLVQALNDDLRRVQETETLRQMEAVKHSRQLELDVSRFEDRLQQQLADELHAINAKHAQQLAALQQDMAVHAAAQSEQTAEAASRVFAEKMRAAEAGSHQQLAAVEADCALKLRALEAEVVRLQHDLAAQKELATLDLQGCQQLLGEKHQRAMAEARGEFEARLQGLAADADAACRKRERDLLLHNETEKLAAVAQCRTHATEVQLRDRHCLEKLEADNKQLAADNIALAERRTADEQAFATATTDLMRQMERLHTELELVKRHASDEVRGELDRLEADREALVRDRDSVLGRMSESMKAQMHAADDERAVLVGRLEQQRQEAEHRIRGDVAALETDYHAKLQEAHARVVSLEAQLASVGHKPVDFALHPAVHPGIESLPAVNILRTNLERLEIENAELRGALAGGSGGGELRRAAEKKAMEDAFHAQMNDAENKAVGRIAEVGAKCHAQVSEMQAVVGSLEARLVDREAQLQHSDKELKRAQQAIAEITLIYQAREKDFVSELHRAQLGHASLRHSPSMDMQQQQQLEHAMFAANAAANDGAMALPYPGDLVNFPTDDSQHRQQKTINLNMNLAAQQRRSPTPDHSRTQIQIQHAFSQKMANQQAALLKQQLQQQQQQQPQQQPVRAPHPLLSQKSGLRPRQSLTPEQFAAL